jgi:hypothetical protein
MRRHGGLARLGGLVNGTLDDLGLRQHVLEQQAVTRYREIVGPQIAASSSAQMVRDGILFVSCRSSTWANELTLLKPEILEKLQSALGRKAVKDVRFSARGFKKALAQAEEVAVDLDSIPLDQSDLDAAARIASAAPPEMAARIEKAILTAKRREKMESETPSN